MQDHEKTQSLLIDELNEMRQRVAELERREADLEQKNRALSVSQDTLRSLLHSSPEPMVVYDAEGHVLFVNSACSITFGWSVKDLLGRHIDYVPEEYLPQTRETLERSFKGERVPPFETQRLTKDGKVLDVYISSALFRNEEGQLAGRVVTLRDITEFKRSENELRRSEYRYRTLFERARDSIMIIGLEGDRRGQIVAANPVAAEMHGYKLEEILTLKISDINTPESSEKLSEGIDRILKGEWLKEESTHRRKDGRVFPIEISVGVLELENEKYALAIDRDITERKLAEQALRESEQSSRLLIEQAPIGIGIMQDGVLTNVNPQFLKIFGYDSMHEVLGHPVEDFYSPEDRALITQRRKDRLSEKPLPMHYEVKGLKKNGESFDLEVWPTVVDYEGKPAILTFCADMSETKSLRSQLLQAQKMEAIGTLAGGVAHDFNNLLQIALGYSELLLVGKHPDHPDYRNLHTINASAKRGAKLVQRLMVFSRKGDTKPRPLNLNHEVAQVKKLLERTIPKMIAIELSLESWLPVINADPVQVEQILLNLAINAKDAMPEAGGKLTIETRNITLDEEYSRVHLQAKPGHYVMLSVEDTGHGMSQETMQHIFEPFFTTKGGKGTGLGLAMVYGIMKQHEGFISCYSEPSHGTTFRIYFPVVSTELEEDSEQDSAVPQGGSETILLVDDEEFLCDMGSQLLTRAGYTVLTATNGRKALDLYRKERIDISLVILDLIMPEMGGKECFQELVNINPKVKVILCSGFLSNGTAEEARVFGVRGSVEKPYNMRKLLETVREVLDED